MLEAQVEVSDALGAKAYKRAMSSSAMNQLVSYYGRNLVIVCAVIAVADAIAGAADLITYHFVVLFVTAIIAIAWQYRKWSLAVDAMSGWSFHAAVDDDGVRTTSNGDTRRMQWSAYRNYVEFEDYLQIEHADGTYSFLPKTPELFELIEFTKTKIAEK